MLDQIAAREIGDGDHRRVDVFVGAVKFTQILWHDGAGFRNQMCREVGLTNAAGREN